MRLSTLQYYFREAILSILRNSWLSAASVGVVAVSLLILGSSLLLVLNANYIADNLESSVEISIFLEEETQPAQIRDLENRILATPGVAELRFVSKQRALEEMKKSFGDNTDILAGLEESNPLPDAFRVKAHDADQVTLLAGQLETLPSVESVRYGQGIVEKVVALSHWVRTAGLVTMALLGLASVFLIASTIRLSVYSRRKEINVMKFLGATDWFVRVPFILEGMILGLAGSLLAVVMVYLGYFSLVGNIQASLPFMQLISDRVMVMPVIQGLVLLGLVIGAAGSLLSLRRFLNV